MNWNDQQAVGTEILLPIIAAIQPLLKARIGKPANILLVLLFAEADVCKLSWRISPFVTPKTGVHLDERGAVWPAGQWLSRDEEEKVMIIGRVGRKQVLAPGTTGIRAAKNTISHGLSFFLLPTSSTFLLSLGSLTLHLDIWPH